MTMDSENFPRGGTVKPKKRRLDNADNLFTTESKTKKPRKEKKSRKAKQAVTVESLAALSPQGSLTYSKIQEGMIILSCVRHITNFTVKLEFPGLTYGLVTINCISDAFTQSISRKIKEGTTEEPSDMLKRIFQIGQLVPAKIIEIIKTEKGHDMKASLNPKDINRESAHSSFKKGCTMWCNVLSELDHGYELSAGVKNCRIFLPHKNIDEGKKYEIGQPLYCVVHRCEEYGTATTLTVSSKKQHLDKVQVDDNQDLNSVIPGTKIELVVEKVLPNGVTGQFLENNYGYIDKTQKSSKLKFSNIIEGSILPAYVLYREPITKITHLTLLNDNLPLPKLELGQVINSQVKGTLQNGLQLKLAGGHKGFVANKRILNTLPKGSADGNIAAKIKKKYPVGSSHRCRVLDFNHMQQLYICTFEPKLVKEKLFTPKDLQLGQLVSIKVEKIQPNGLIVNAGHVQGFVPNLHLSNTEYTENIKGKFKVGSTANARVLNITEEGNVIFTLKQGLLESENCLYDAQAADPNTKYAGFVVSKKVSGVIIAFYGDAKAWLTNKDLNLDNTGAYNDPQEYFFRGQVVNVWPMGFKNDWLRVSLNPPEKRKTKRNINIGYHAKGVIKAVHAKGMDVEIEKGTDKIQVTVPMLHLANSPSLCSPLLRTFKIGDTIEGLMCIKNWDTPVFSRRECLAREANGIKMLKLRDLRKHMILRCSFEARTTDGIWVSTPLIDYHENIFIPNENLTSVDEKVPVFQELQCVLAKIVKVETKPRTIVLDARRESVLEGNMQKALNLLGQDLEDIDRLIKFGQEKGWKLTQYKIGERVPCVVKQITAEGGCEVLLPNGIDGIVAPDLCNAKTKSGATVEGVVVDYNFVEDSVEVCLKNDIKQRINKVQDGVINKEISSSCMAQVILEKDRYAVGILKHGSCNRQLVYLPINYNECHDKGIKSAYMNKKVKVMICRHVSNRIIGAPKKLAIGLKDVLKQNKSLKKKQSTTKSQKTKKAKPVLAKVSAEESEQQQREEIEQEDKTLDPDNSTVNEENGQESTNLDNSTTQIDEDDSDDTESEDEDSVEQVKGEETVEIKEEPMETDTKDDLNLAPVTPVLSGVSSFYGLEDVDVKEEDSSSDDENEGDQQAKKKKKLSLKEEDARLRLIERELEDPNFVPQTPAHFDRLVMKNKDSSELWLRYIAMHVSATEINKARAVGQRALEEIDKTLDKERLNVWMALLQLENTYGTTDSFDALFNEAVKYNDSLEIYLYVIKIFAAAGKLSEMEEKIKKIRPKEKQNPKMWKEIGEVYYSLGKFKDARNFRDFALKSIIDPKRQFDLIMKWAIMEFHYGELDQAINNFEIILENHWSKSMLWIVYVDQLVKKKEIDLARSVLVRATNLKLPIKCMRALFQKFAAFEEKHGTAENVAEVMEKLKKYKARHEASGKF